MKHAQCSEQLSLNLDLIKYQYQSKCIRGLAIVESNSADVFSDIASLLNDPEVKFSSVHDKDFEVYMILTRDSDERILTFDYIKLSELNEAFLN